MLHLMLQIVNTLISKKEYADKMLLYAENHNQVTHPLFDFVKICLVCFSGIIVI